jgi:hypothetical protein
MGWRFDGSASLGCAETATALDPATPMTDFAGGRLFVLLPDGARARAMRRRTGDT